MVHCCPQTLTPLPSAALLANKPPSGAYFKFWLISPSPPLPFFCTPVPTFSCMVELLGLVSTSKAWLFHLWRPDQSQTGITGSCWFLLVLSWWQHWTFSWFQKEVRTFCLLPSFNGWSLSPQSCSFICSFSKELEPHILTISSWRTVLYKWTIPKSQGIFLEVLESCFSCSFFLIM